MMRDEPWFAFDQNNLHLLRNINLSTIKARMACQPTLIFP
jgi:hypothetical protein